jgi:hypothetical protein
MVKRGRIASRPSRPRASLGSKSRVRIGRSPSSSAGSFSSGGASHGSGIGVRRSPFGATRRWYGSRGRSTRWGIGCLVVLLIIVALVVCLSLAGVVSLGGLF